MKLITPNHKYIYWTISFSLLIGTTLPSLALTVEEVPNPRQEDGSWVTDMSDILSNKTEAKLNELILQLEQQNGTEIAVVTVPETTPSATSKEFTTELFNYWGIGKADEDNGVLFLISTADRRVEIETGYGIEAILPDAKVSQIIDTKITPQFKQENYDDGTLAGTQALVETLQTPDNRASEKETISREEIKNTIETQSDNFGWIPFFVVLFGAIAIFGRIFNKRKRRGGAWNKSSSNASSASNINSASNGNSGSSGGSFGGGSSGGGGAGGDY